MKTLEPPRCPHETLGPEAYKGYLQAYQQYVTAYGAYNKAQSTAEKAKTYASVTVAMGKTKEKSKAPAPSSAGKSKVAAKSAAPKVPSKPKKGVPAKAGEARTPAKDAAPKGKSANLRKLRRTLAAKVQATIVAQIQNIDPKRGNDVKHQKAVFTQLWKKASIVDAKALPVIFRAQKRDPRIAATILQKYRKDFLPEITWDPTAAERGIHTFSWPDKSYDYVGADP